MEQIRSHWCRIAEPALGHGVFAVVAVAFLAVVAALVVACVKVAGVGVDVNDVVAGIDVGLVEFCPQLAVFEFGMPRNYRVQCLPQFLAAEVACGVVVVCWHLSERSCGAKASNKKEYPVQKFHR